MYENFLISIFFIETKKFKIFPEVVLWNSTKLYDKHFSMNKNFTTRIFCQPGGIYMEQFSLLSKNKHKVNLE